MRNHVVVSMGLPNEKIVGLKFLYIVIDSNGRIHYEFNNKGHIILPIHRNEINPLKIWKNLPKNLIKKCVSDKKNIVGIMQLWIYYTKDYYFGRIRGIGILEDYRGKKISALARLFTAMDEFVSYYGIKFVECETSVMSPAKMERFGFYPEPERGLIKRFGQFVFRQTHYVKKYGL